MLSTLRFGKKLPIPSTIDIRHELKLMAAADALLTASSHEERAAIIRDLAREHGFSHERAEMLVDRFGIGRDALAGASHDLVERRASVAS